MPAIKITPQHQPGMVTPMRAPRSLARQRVTASSPASSCNLGIDEDEDSFKLVQSSASDSICDSSTASSPSLASTPGGACGWTNAHNSDDTRKATPTPPRLRFEARGAATPHPQKKNNGEDAYYISTCGSSMGVADGVGGWADRGVDAGLYSSELMEGARKLVEDFGETDPRTMLSTAYDQTTVVGSSTACIATLQESTLRIANLGDSGLLVLRRTIDRDCPQGKIAATWKCVLETEAQQHYFNCPRQLGSESQDRPEDADYYEMDLQDGDLVIMASDGLFDNVSTEVLCDWMDAVNAASHLDANREDNLSGAILEVAHRLLLNTSAVSMHPTADTPFATRAKQVGVNFRGGKKDDITVLVGMAVANEDASPVSSFGERVGAEDLRRASDGVCSSASSTSSADEGQHDMSD